MDEREIVYEEVGNYTKYKLVEMLIEKHRDSFKNLNQVEQLADDILNVLSKCGLKYYNELKEGFNANRD
jgi:Txe/YoeB family toxin of Txe-Axe toxin-antitoxin module